MNVLMFGWEFPPFISGGLGTACAGLTEGVATEKTLVARADRHSPALRPVVTSLGHITYQKGPEYFIEAARLVLQRGKDVSFVMAGDGDLLPRMKSLVTALGIADHFTFPGFIDAGAVADLFARSDVYVMPSVSEPFGIAALEAINAQVPTIISNNCGPAELVESVIKLAPDDCAATADAIVRLIDEPAYAQRLATGASAELRKVSWDEAAGSLKDLYAQLVAEPC